MNSSRLWLNLWVFLLAAIPVPLLAGKKVQTFTQYTANRVSSEVLVGKPPAQQTISGTVVDPGGIGLPGVSVVVKGTSHGTMTDENGNFSLPAVEDNAILEISYVGYKTQEISIAGQSVLKITLAEDTELLEEVVIVGYGTQKKESVTGSIVQASEEELKRTGNTPDLAQALTGQLPGIVTLTSSGEPGGITTGEIGRASGRERVVSYVSSSGDAV